MRDLNDNKDFDDEFIEYSLSINPSTLLLKAENNSNLNIQTAAIAEIEIEADDELLGTLDADKISMIENAEFGDLQSMYALVEVYTSKKNLKKAFKWLIRISESNDQDALVWYKLAECYYNGKGTERNAKQGAACYLKAAKRGHNEAMLRVAEILESIDAVSSIKYYTECAQGGNPIAQYKLSVHFKEIDEDEHFMWLEKAAINGHATACYEWAMIKKNRKEYQDCVRFLKIASEQKNADAAFELAYFYILGKGNLDRNRTTAYSYLERAFALGHQLSNKSMVSTIKSDENIRLFTKYAIEKEMKENPELVLMPKEAKTGYLFKMSKKGKEVVQKRYFVLNGPFFSYFKENDCSYPSWKICVRGATFERIPEKETSDSFYLAIRKGSNVLKVSWSNEATIESWRKELEDAKIYYEYFEKDNADMDEATSYILDSVPISENWKLHFVEKASKTGYIAKQGGKWRNWNKRWFVLYESKLFYFKDEYAIEAEGVISLENAAIRFNESDPTSFEIYSQYRSYFLRCKFSGESTEWIRAIKSTIAQYSPQIPVDLSTFNQRAKVKLNVLNIESEAPKYSDSSSQFQSVDE